MTDNQSKMVFLNRLPEPIYLQNGEKKTSILYFGIAQDMEQLNPYFNCEAYNGNNSVYVLDDNGSKLFNSNQVELIKGHNVFSVLQNMKYLHNSSFEKTKAELEEKGCSYSNAVLDGTEYFYGLKRMENAEWTLIFLVPAEYVATNTLKLVNFVLVFIVIFTVIVAVCVMLGISFVMYRNQQEAIRVERENNAKLETVNTKLRQAKQAAEDAFQVAQEANRSKSSFPAFWSTLRKRFTTSSAPDSTGRRCSTARSAASVRATARRSRTISAPLPTKTSTSSSWNPKAVRPMNIT